MSRERSVLTPGVVAQVIVFVVAVPLLPLLISWRWDWWQAWVYGVAAVGGFVVSRALAARRHADLLRERARFLHHEDAKGWDKVLAPLVGLGGAAIPLVAGLDARFGWSGSFTLTAHLVSLGIILSGYALGSYALVENRYFSGMVRIQYDRDHKVVTTGPYRWIRHPGYAGAILTYLATPAFLDSIWSILPVAVLTAVLMIRTFLEDRALRDELPGYRDYARSVRFRLLPGVW
jgi:protein-S-isoprenylcysteine O-methyltransferase Ste14